jgi:hypothetical protein
MDSAGREKIAREFQEERAKKLEAVRENPHPDKVSEVCDEVIILREVAYAAASLIPHLDRLGLQTPEYRKMREALLKAALVGGF